MRKKEIVVRKIVASLLVLIMALTHSAIVGITAISYAVDMNTTNSGNVQLKAYFVSNGEETTQVQRNINDENLNLNIDVTVKNEGYFNGQISLVNSGFKLKEKFNSEYIEKIENDIIYLKQINTDETAKIQVGIKSINEDEVPEQSLNTNTKVTLTGTYYSSNKEVQITGESEVNVVWTMPQETKAMLAGKLITNSIYKIENENKRVVQYLILSKVTHNNYPVKNTEIQATIPEGVQKVEVHKRSTKATNGDKDFSTNNYKVENNLLKINVANTESNGKISWQKNTYDTYVVTYEYNEKADLSNKKISLNSNITMCDSNQTALKAEQQQLDLKQEIHGLVTSANEELENEIYKGKICVGQERDFTTDTKVYVDYAKGVNQININLAESIYIRNEQRVKANILYKELKLNKQNISSVLGDTWEILLQQDGDDETIITNESEADEDGNIIVNFEDGAKNLVLLTSKVQNNGTILIKTTKTIYDAKYKKEDLQTLTGIQDNTEVKYSDNENKIYQTNEMSSINFKDTKTDVRLELEKNILTSSDEAQELNLTAILKTDSEEKDLYKNPKIAITLPPQINVEDLQTKLVYANGLQIDDSSLKVEKVNGQDVITISLKGEQKTYQEKAIDGTRVLINTQVRVKEQKQDASGDIVLKYTNENAKNYANNATQKASIKILSKVTDSEESGQQLNNEQASYKQLEYSLKAQVRGQDVRDGEIVKAGEIIVYEITMTNKDNKNIENLNIEATIPEDTTLIGVNPNYPAYDNVKHEYTEGEDYLIQKTDTKIKKDGITIEAGKTATYSYMVKVKSDLSGDKVAETSISVKHGNTALKELKFSNKFEQGSLEVTCIPVFRKPNTELLAGYNYMYEIHVKNATNKKKDNVQVTIDKSDIINISEFSWFIDEENWDDLEKDKMTFTLESIPANDTAIITINATMNLSKNKSKDISLAKISATVKDSEANMYRSNQLAERVVGVKLKASISAEVEGSQSIASASRGNQIKYIIKLKNNGTMDAQELVVDDQFSDYLDLQSVSLNGNQCSYEQENLVSEDANYNLLHINSNLQAGKEATIVITGKVKEDLPDSNNDIEITNKATVYNEGVKLAETNETKSIIRKTNNNEEEPDATDVKTVSGIAWLDTNKNGSRDLNEQLLEGINVYIIDVTTNMMITDKDGNQITTTTNSDGEYILNNIPNGKYIVAFGFDTQKYNSTQYQADSIGDDNNSDAIKINKTVDTQELTLAFTDCISLSENKSNIDVGLVEIPVFDLELEKVVTKATIINSAGTKEKEFKETNSAKVRINKKQLKDTKVVIEYKIKIKNAGDVAGYASNIVDYIPSSLAFDSSLNKDWYEKDNKIYNESLAKTKIQPGETKELKLILTKTMTEANTGLTHNIAEIAKDYNNLGILDKDSNLENKNTNEDDLASADIIISVGTGTWIIYTCLAILSIAIIGGIAYLVIRKKLKDTMFNRKEV